MSHKAQLGDDKAKRSAGSDLAAGMPSSPRQIRVASLLASLGDDKARSLLSEVAIVPGTLQVSAGMRCVCSTIRRSADAACDAVGSGDGDAAANPGGARESDTAATNQDAEQAVAEADRRRAEWAASSGGSGRC